jgi:hypothetical protein
MVDWAWQAGIATPPEHFSYQFKLVTAQNVPGGRQKLIALANRARLVSAVASSKAASAT